MTFTYVCFIPVGTSGPISRASFWYTATAIHQHFECFKGSVSKLMWSFRDAKIGRGTFRSTKGEELGKTEVKPTVSASESGDPLTLRQPKNWKTQLKEDLVLPDLRESISKRYPRNGGFELSKTPHNLEWPKIEQVLEDSPPKIAALLKCFKPGWHAPGCVFSRKSWWWLHFSGRFKATTNLWPVENW